MGGGWSGVCGSSGDLETGRFFVGGRGVVIGGEILGGLC